MPSRFVTVGIVVFWLGTAGWWFAREVAPRLRTSGPPPITIDLADEAGRNSLPISWTIYHDHEPIGSAIVEAKRGGNIGTRSIGNARTRIVFLEDRDLFRLAGRFDFRMPILGGEGHFELHCSYLVNRAGHLQQVRADLQAELPKLSEQQVQGHLEGTVRDGQLHPEVRVSAAGLERQLSVQPVAIGGAGSVLNPLHPVNRLAGLRPGQRWRLPLFDPMAASLAGLLPGSGASELQWLDAEVLSESKPLVWGEDIVTCLVVRYRGRDTEACTWVRAEDGLVLRQEVESGSGRLILERNRR